MSRHTRRICVLLAGTMLVGCATIMNQTTQSIGFSSTPTGASVTIDGTPRGTTPVIARLARRKPHVVKIELAGYQPFETTLTRRFSGWVFGNILLGGLIGLAIDMVSGGMYKLTPDQVRAELRANGALSQLRNDTLYAVVVLKPNPAWQKIGQFTKAQPGDTEPAAN